MANTDQNTSLPVRSESDGLDERLHVKIVDGTTTAINQMTVDSDKNAHVEIHGNDTSAVDRVVRLSERGAITPDGIYDLTNNKIPGNIGLIASTRQATPGDTFQTERITSIKYAPTNTTSLDVSIHDESGHAYSETNPLPVTSVDNEGVNKLIYAFTPSDVAKAGTANLDYSVTSGKTLKIRQVCASASGKIKLEVSTSPDGLTFTTFAVFFNATADQNIMWTLPTTLDTTGVGSKVRLHLTNLDNQPQTIYTTISGYEV